jgi:hypothetical protein
MLRRCGFDPGDEGARAFTLLREKGDWTLADDNAAHIAETRERRVVPDMIDGNQAHGDSLRELARGQSDAQAHARQVRLEVLIGREEMRLFDARDESDEAAFRRHRRSRARCGFLRRAKKRAQHAERHASNPA